MFKKTIYFIFSILVQVCNSMTSQLQPLQPSPCEENNDGVARVKCGARGCVGSTVKLVDCYAPDCSKQVHITCYERLVVLKYKVDELIDPANNKKLFICSKTCYNKVEKAIVNQPSRIPWEKDGRNGPTDPNTSLKILLDWLLVEGNYMQFRGCKNNGTRKQTYGQQIADKIKDAGCRIERSADAVVKKIQEIEGRFIKAHDWVNNTGQGVKENESAETFEGLVRQRCKWYFELAPIMGDRSKARPKVPNMKQRRKSDNSTA